MSTTIVSGKSSFFFGARAFLLDETRDMAASDWTSEHIKTNPALKWIVGRYAEADRANSNRQYWSLENLRQAEPSIQHAPLNMLHQSHSIVGSYVASKMLYPTGVVDGASADYAGDHPHIEALAAFWKYYFPEALKKVEEAHNEGSLFFSMECIADSMTFETADGSRSQEFDYAGPNHPSYGEWNADPTAIRKFNNPHFLGGALIIPPIQPGWKNADIREISQYIEEHQEEAQGVYQGVKDEASHLSESKLEEITIGLMLRGMDLGANNSIFEKPQTKHDSADELSADDHVNEELLPNGGGDSMDKTYTEEELAAAVAEAVAPFKTQLDELNAKASAEEIEVQIAAVRAEYDEQIEEIRKDLDAAVLAAEAAKEEHANLVAFLEAEAAAAEDAAKREALRDERAAAVKEVANFPDAYVEAQIDRWVAMSDEDFAASVEDYRAASTAAHAKSQEVSETELAEVIPETAMQNTREDAPRSALREVAELRRTGFDPRTL